MSHEVTGDNKCCIIWMVSPGTGMPRGEAPVGRRLSASACGMVVPGQCTRTYSYAVSLRPNRYMCGDIIWGTALLGPRKPSKGLWSVSMVTGWPQMYWWLCQARNYGQCLMINLCIIPLTLSKEPGVIGNWALGPILHLVCENCTNAMWWGIADKQQWLGGVIMNHNLRWAQHLLCMVERLLLLYGWTTPAA